MIYHKIQSVFKRDPETKHKTFLMDQYTLPEFEYLRHNKWVFTEKVDGTNIRIYWNFEEKKIRIGGRTNNAQIPTFLYEKLMDTFTPTSFEDFTTDVVLYGEGYGARIQKGGGNYIPDGVDFVLFDVKIGEWWLKREDVDSMATNVLNVKSVPIVGQGTLDIMVHFVRNGFNSQWGDFLAEGVVARPEVELKDRAGRRIITKLKYKDFQ